MMNTTTNTNDANLDFGFTKDDVDQLNSFIRGELSAVETYQQAIDKIDGKPMITETLRECQNSHRERATRLSGYVRRLGGEPADSSGAWGTMVKLLEGGAKLFGEKAAISVLEEGEDHGLADYRRDMSDMSAPVRAYVSNQILPEQQRTHDRLSAVEDRL